MKVSIDVFLDIEGSQLRSGGTFNVYQRDYMENPNLAVAFVAYRYIEEIIKETGYRETKIDKVVYEGNKDITELTRQIRKIPSMDNLPF